MIWPKSAIPQIVDWYTRDCTNDEYEPSSESMEHLYSLAKERGFYAHNFKGNLTRRNRVESTGKALDLKTLESYGINPWEERFWVKKELDWNKGEVPFFFWQGLLEEVFVKTGQLYAKKDVKVSWRQHPPVTLPEPNPENLRRVLEWFEQNPDEDITQTWYSSKGKEPIPDHLPLTAREPEVQYFKWIQQYNEYYDTSILQILDIVPNWFYDGAFWSDSWPQKEQQIYIPVLLRAKPFIAEAPRPGHPRAVITAGKNYVFKKGTVLRWNYPVILSQIYKETSLALTRAELILPKISEGATTQGGFEIVG